MKRYNSSDSYPKAKPSKSRQLSAEEEQQERLFPCRGQPVVLVGLNLNRMKQELWLGVALVVWAALSYWLCWFRMA